MTRVLIASSVPIAERLRTPIRTLIVVTAIAAIAAGCTFAGTETSTQNPADEWFVEEAWPHAKRYAESNGLNISQSEALVMRYADSVSVDVAFTESGGKRSVSVSFALGGDSKWALIPANAVSLLDPERWGWGVEVVVRTIGDVPKVYRIEEELGHREVREIAEVMTTRLMDDLKVGETGRTFAILDWKDLVVRADRMYDAWVVTGEVSVRYEGVLSPVGDGSLVPRGEYARVSLGERHLKNVKGVFILAIPSGEVPSAILEPPLLTPDMSVGVGVDPDYVNDERLIFHGYFGLFVYDLKAGKITFSADLAKAVGTTIIQGSEGAAVRVSADGNTIQLYYSPERGVPVMTYTIDACTGEYDYGPYRPLDAYDTSSHSCYERFSGGTLGELTYADGENSWLLFADWAY